MKITNEQIAELETLANAAPTGIWKTTLNHHKAFINESMMDVITSDGKVIVCERVWSDSADFIAALNPATVLSLLEEIKASREAIEYYSNSKNWLVDTCQVRDDRQTVHFYKGSMGDFVVGGKRARAHLERFTGEK